MMVVSVRENTEEGTWIFLERSAEFKNYLNWQFFGKKDPD